MTTDTAPTATIRPAAQHRRRPVVPVWIRAARPVLLVAILAAAALVTWCAGLFVVTVAGAIAAALSS